MTFFSHGPDKKIPLDTHLVCVADRAKQLVASSKFNSSDVAYYAGLFHDLGKLNPYYQKLFSGEDKTLLFKNHPRFHSLYSCWLAKNYLTEIKMDKENKKRTIMIIAGHHSKLRQQTTQIKNPNLMDTASNILKVWDEFIKDAKPPLKDLPKISPSCDRIEYKKILKVKPDENHIAAFLECGFLFSCLLQADRGSFSEFTEKKLDDSFIIDTQKLVSNDTELGTYRTKLQETVSDKINTDIPITVINAPTGTGKTKAFLDLVKRYGQKRVFYFSPLLALTDDISDKLTSVCKKNEKEILVYNHTFTNTLNEKTEDGKKMPESYNFDFEAFNEKMIVTTTQRLLMTIYSNSYKDKLKLASLRDSLLIIDEVQTLPKFLLKNLIDVLNAMNKYLNTKTILVSATIPHELSNLPTITMSEELTQKYLQEKNRNIIKETKFSANNITSGKTLIMLNTRKKAKDTFEKLDKKSFYISSGIKKDHRAKILKDIKESKDSILVSTQVIEAGVDISFDNIWRQMAPIDNIIQVMGRLDRESQNKKSTLHLFDLYPADHTPYCSLEFKESQKIISKISNSAELYDNLEYYYKQIHDKNNAQKESEQNLDYNINELDFEQVWSIIKKHIGDSYYDSVYIPDTANWDSVKNDLLSNSKSAIKRHAGLLAQLPVNRSKLPTNIFDEDLAENDIWYPKKDAIEQLYDKDLGLDKWR